MRQKSGPEKEPTGQGGDYSHSAKWGWGRQYRLGGLKIRIRRSARATRVARQRPVGQQVQWFRRLAFADSSGRTPKRRVSSGKIAAS